MDKIYKCPECGFETTFLTCPRCNYTIVHQPEVEEKLKEYKKLFEEEEREVKEIKQKREREEKYQQVQKEREQRLSQFSGCFWLVALFMIIGVFGSIAEGNGGRAFINLIFWGFVLFLIYLKGEARKTRQEEKIRQEKEEQAKKERWFAAKKTIDDLYKMNPFEFEEFIAKLYQKLGYEAFKTKSSGDEGIDVRASKDGKDYVIQVKRSGKPVGSPVIQKLYGSMAHVLADYGICVSLAGFTTAAKNFANGKMIELIDGHDLVKLINDSQNSSQL
jgi:hypothetical protein